MYIVDRHKDFYDYLSHAYGVDKGIVFDRRESTIMDNESLVALASTPRMYDTYLRLLFLEVGACHYLIKLFNFKIVRDPLTLIERVISFDIELAHKYPISENRFGSPISIHEASNYMWFVWKWGSRWRRRDAVGIEIPSIDEVVRYVNVDRSIPLPILRDTSLTKILDAHTIWMEIQTYISSLDNDKDVSLDMTDKEKAQTHGFDKQSFRHPVKL